MAAVENETRYIRPYDRFEAGYVRSFLIMLSTVIRRRDVIAQLFKRDFLARYRRSFIGATWVIISPVAAIVSWLFLHKANILQPGHTDVPYPAYVLLGTLVWSLFTTTFRAATETLRSTISIVRHLNLAHELLFIEQVLVALANVAVSFVLALLVMLLFGVAPSWGVVLFPVVMLPLLLTASAAGLVVGLFAVISYDISRIATAFVALLMFVTPVIYAPGAVRNPTLARLVELNPLTHMVRAAREIVFTGTLDSPGQFAVLLAASFVFFVVCWRTFYIAENRVVERVF